jgi:PAS domain S-box-containing protein
MVEEAPAQAQDEAHARTQTGWPATVAIDARGVITAWDAAATELFGYRGEETLGRPLSEVVVPVRLRAAHEAGLRRVHRDGYAPLLDTRLDMPALHRDGHEFHVEMVLAREDDQFVARLRGLDAPSPVSGELYLAAKGYQRRERLEMARMATLIESMTIGILLLDEHQRIVLTNAAFVELFELDKRGLTPDKLRGTAPRGPGGAFTTAFADREAAEQRIEETVRRGRPAMGEEVVLAGGHVLERDYLPVALDGDTLGHLWIFRDMTAQAAVRRGLEDRNRMLTEVANLKTEFVRVASHELRTPLTSIATFASMLGGHLDPDDEEIAVAAIRRNAERLQILVADLLLLAQLESGETSLTLRPLDLAAIVGEACNAAGVQATIGTGPRVEGDEAFLWQLVTTAVGVVVDAADPEAPVHASATCDSGKWTVEVTTETAEPASEERLLSTRLPHPDAEGEHRTGALALMLAREIATRHGGALTTVVAEAGMTITLRL